MQPRELSRRYFAKYKAKPENLVKHKARERCADAIKAGKLVRQPCEACGSDENTEAHHEDYSKPLDVRWLCGPCHKGVHGAYSHRTHCLHGHVLTGHNVMLVSRGYGRSKTRKCRECHNISVSKSKRRKRMERR